MTELSKAMQEVKTNCWLQKQQQPWKQKKTKKKHLTSFQLLEIIVQLRGDIASSLAPVDAIAFCAFALFCLGSPSWIKKRDCPFLLFRRIYGKCSVTKLLKNSPSNLSYSSQHVTPCLKEIAIKSFKALPPVPTCVPFAVHPLSRPSLVCRQTRPFGARLWSHGLYLWVKLAPSK